MASAPKPPQSPKLNPIDIPGTIMAAMNADSTAYALSDADFASRFPGLVSGRQFSMADALQQLQHPPEAVVKDFAKQGVMQSLSAFGGGNQQAAVGGQGSSTRNQATSTAANLLLNNQDQNRNYVQNLLGAFPERAYGISGADVASLAIANTGTLNANNAQQYQNNVVTGNMNYQSQMQQYQAIAGLGMAVAGMSDIRLKENVNFVQMHDGYGIFDFNYIGKPERWRGVIAQDIISIRPDAVTEIDGYYAVDYSKLGLKMERTK